MYKRLNETNVSELKPKPALATFGHDPNGKLGERLQSVYPTIADIFTGGMTFALSEPSLKKYLWEVQDLQGIENTVANQSKQFRTALEHTTKKCNLKETKGIVLIDYDRLLHAAHHYPDELKELADFVQSADFTFCCRSEDAFKSHPPAMIESESPANNKATSMIWKYLPQKFRNRIDYFSGAYGISLELLAEFPFHDLTKDKRPVYPVFVGNCMRLLGKDKHLTIHSPEFDCLSYETPYEARDEITEMGYTPWLMTDRGSLKERKKREKMNIEWTEILRSYLTDSTRLISIPKSRKEPDKVSIARRKPVTKRNKIRQHTKKHKKVNGSEKFHHRNALEPYSQNREYKSKYDGGGLFTREDIESAGMHYIAARMNPDEFYHLATIEVAARDYVRAEEYEDKIWSMVLKMRVERGNIWPMGNLARDGDPYS